MLAVTNSTAWSAAVRRSHVATFRCELWSGTTKIANLYPISGSVTVDARRDVRRSCSLSFVDFDGSLTPSATNLNLAPYGNEIKLFRGINYGDGTSDEVPLGVFRITETQVSYNEDAVSISITGDDRAKAIMEKPFSTAFTIGTSTNFADAILNVVSDRLGNALTNIAPTSYATPSSGFGRALGFGVESNPWADISEIARAIGHEAFFDAYGTFTTQPIPSLDTTSAVATYADGSDGVTVSIDRTLTSDSSSNGVIFPAEGTHLSAPLEAVVWDDDASSPFRRTGPLGERPASFSSSWIVNAAQLADAARSQYQAVRGQPITLSIVPDPRLDVRDVISITSATLGVSTLAVIDTIEIPFDVSSPMTITARTKGY